MRTPEIEKRDAAELQLLRRVYRAAIYVAQHKRRQSADMYEVPISAINMLLVPLGQLHELNKADKKSKEKTDADA